MARWILAAIVLAAASGCEGVDFSEKKQEAQKRWFNARARVLYRLAENRFSSGELKEAASSATQALVLQPDYDKPMLLLAKIEIEEGKYSAAIARLREIERARPDSSEVAYLLGAAQEKGGLLSDALANYRRAYALDESNLGAVKAAAEVLTAMGDVRPAQLHVESYLPKAKDDPGMYELAGRLALMTNDFDRAVEYLERARDLDPRNTRYAEMLARAQYSVGRHADAIDTLTELTGRREQKAATWVYLMLGDCHLALGKAHQAFDAYFSASEQAPEDPAVWVALARSALAMKDASRAALAAQRALALAPGELDATLLLGYALLREGRPGEAIEVLRPAADQHPKSATVRCLLGRAFSAGGNVAEAIRWYTSALSVDPGNELARELLAAAGGGEISKVE
ncbi:MAG TPA: tetratricopeptide repeat protein [Phycisphaerae bacterium]|nr:tetratricopeptide repeat protein [Phycisphaerae bacterium]